MNKTFAAFVALTLTFCFLACLCVYALTHTLEAGDPLSPFAHIELGMMWDTNATDCFDTYSMTDRYCYTRVAGQGDVKTVFVAFQQGQVRYISYSLTGLYLEAFRRYGLPRRRIRRYLSAWQWCYGDTLVLLYAHPHDLEVPTMYASRVSQSVPCA